MPKVNDKYYWVFLQNFRKSVSTSIKFYKKLKTDFLILWSTGEQWTVNTLKRFPHKKRYSLRIQDCPFSSEE